MENQQRFEPAIKVYHPNGSTIDSKPSKLWNTIEAHYTDPSEAVSNYKEADRQIEDDELG
ncbi:hypothetical protein CROQUDRAFT_86994 [Cronartium quercuum f. sp. fusiforme G11]|uniref:Uncharacterized protein n=1 Tax=Cronartium quercuum f. sp. fusiforme G11 TaxID=708437 RepID=A0A9P6NX92_9BASI|nr:hypothetical protein CROQUDRAFT_86994 [Cronartium quercuum f. sp. fusiforme G11]